MSKGKWYDIIFKELSIRTDDRYYIRKAVFGEHSFWEILVIRANKENTDYYTCMTEGDVAYFISKEFTNHLRRINNA